LLQGDTEGLTPEAGVVTAQEVIAALAPGPLGPGPECDITIKRLLRLSHAALAKVLSQVASIDPHEAPATRPSIEGQSTLDSLEREAERLPLSDRLRLVRAIHVARRPGSVDDRGVQRATAPHNRKLERLRAREERSFQQRLAADKRDAAWNVAHRASWVEIRRVLDAERGNIDLDFLLGWIDQESGGLTSTQHPGHRLDEVSLFQISLDERRDLQIDTPRMRERLLHDVRTAVLQGLRLVHLERDRLLRAGLNEQSPALWEFVRLMHEVGESATLQWIARLQSELEAGNGVDPANASWEQVKEHARMHHEHFFPISRLRSLDVMRARGAVIRQVLDAAAP
jgi:hypothetical protein